ncbi:MAG TPA: FAD-dependent oxidoreductase [Candidatus Polarisedimenticolia bacterium]|nr:FAD-dependent oxidoreductase [Candidatus Polarisedimenticolia bacterium]
MAGRCRVLTEAAATTPKRPGPRVVVIGAGAFGGWTALWLVRRGARVTLVDARAAGNIQASSGGETRVTRAVYGANAAAMRLAIRAMDLWKEEQSRLGVELYRERGVLWMTTTPDDSYLEAALPLLRAAARPFEEVTPRDAATRWPAMSFDDARRVVLEPMAGYLLARRASETVARQVAAEGGTVRQADVRPPALSDARPPGGTAAEPRLDAVTMHDGERLEADAFVFALGPWLGSFFPGLIGERVRPTRQELFTFATPPGDARFFDDALPTWADLGETLRYGIPGPAPTSGRGEDEARGMKFGDDARGPLFDPTAGDRTPSAEGEQFARAYLARRLPALKSPRLQSAQVCQYENTADNQYLIDRHPHAANVWIAGGGSGHGFKNGPAVGEMLAEMVLGGRVGDPAFALWRLA